MREGPEVETGADPAEQPEVLLFPYLPLSRRRAVGLFELIPREDFADEDAQNRWVAASVRGLVELYRMRSYSRASARSCGRAPERSETRSTAGRCSHSGVQVAAALLDRNRSQTGAEDEAEGQGWSVATSDNALLYGHGVAADGYVAVQYGRMVAATVAGLRIGTDYSEIHAPAEVHTPFLHSEPDGVSHLREHPPARRDVPR